jgi:archaetidylinositol phosphate synthase
MVSSFKPLAEKHISRFVKRLPYLNPNIITILGIIPSIAFFLFIQERMLFAALLSLLATSLDILDGVIARTYGKVTAFGGLLDSTIDRVSDFFLITAFSFSDIVRWEISLLFLLFSFLTSYIRSRAELAGNGKITLSVGVLERSERIAGIFLVVLFSILFPTFRIADFSVAEVGFIILLMLAIITVCQRLWVSYVRLRS